MPLSKVLRFFLPGKKAVPGHGMAQRQQQLDQRMLEMSRSLSSEHKRLKQTAAEALKHCKGADHGHAFGIALRTTYDTIMYFEDYLKRLDKLYSAARKEGLAYAEKEIVSFFSPAIGVMHLYAMALACSLHMRKSRILTHEDAKLSKYISALSKKADSFFGSLPGTVHGVCRKNGLPVSSEMTASLDTLSRLSAELLKLSRKKDLSMRDLKNSAAARDLASWDMHLP